MTLTERVLCCPFRESEFYKLILHVFPTFDFLLLPLNDHFFLLSWVLYLYLSLDWTLLSSVWTVFVMLKKDIGLESTHPGSRFTYRTPGVPVLWADVYPFQPNTDFIKSPGFFPKVVNWEQKCALSERGPGSSTFHFPSACLAFSEFGSVDRVLSRLGGEWGLEREKSPGKGPGPYLPNEGEFSLVYLVGRAHLIAEIQHFSSLQRKVIWRDSCK